MQAVAQKKSSVRLSVSKEREEKESSTGSIEMLTEGQECPFCHFATLKREGNEIFCPVCGYGRSACT